MGATQTPADLQPRCPGRELNATKHGILSRHAVLPWEDRAEFDALLASLVGDHAPEGATEHHLVEELAVVIWRKQRVLLAETACQRAELQRRLEWDHHGLARRAMSPLGAGLMLQENPRAAVAARLDRTEQELHQLTADEAGAMAAVKILRAGGPGAYQKALGALTEDLQDGWDEALVESSMSEALTESLGDRPDGWHDDEICRPDAASLLRFLENTSVWLRMRRRQLEDRIQVKSQAMGEAVDVERLDKVARYEAHLDRKLGRTLATLLKLQEIRRTIKLPAA